MRERPQRTPEELQLAKRVMRAMFKTLREEGYSPEGGLEDTETLSTEVPFGVRLRQIRHMRGITASDLARKIGVDPSTIYRIEIGDNATKLDTAVAISRVLKVPIDKLAGQEIPQSE